MFVRTSFTFTLMTTGAFSWNISKLFSGLKLVTDNLSLYLCSNQLRSHWKGDGLYGVCMASWPTANGVNVDWAGVHFNSTSQADLQWFQDCMVWFIKYSEYSFPYERPIKNESGPTQMFSSFWKGIPTLEGANSTFVGWATLVLNLHVQGTNLSFHQEG